MISRIVEGIVASLNASYRPLDAEESEDMLAAAIERSKKASDDMLKATAKAAELRKNSPLGEVLDNLARDR